MSTSLEIFHAKSDVNYYFALGFSLSLVVIVRKIVLSPYNMSVKFVLTI